MVDNYEAVIGLETHVELSTKTKMFCGCEVIFGRESNTLTCPVCLGLPGSLPVINKKALQFALKIALALNCRINDRTIFHRKNYFYPDMPKNYQISQYDIPLGTDGQLDIEMGDYTRRVGITRVHMEEDAGKLIHTGSTGRISESGASIVDFNRAGTPLIEIVTEPDIRSAVEAKEYMLRLKELLLYLDVSDCNMEEGSLRCDANLSIRKKGQKGLGTKTEIKNLNSFKFLQKGLEYEISRQIRSVEDGKEIIQQTRHYDSFTGRTKALRTKEEAHDYRYFPEPDLVPLFIDEKMIDEISASIPELPEQKAKRFEEVYKIPKYDSTFLSRSKSLADYFEEILKHYDRPKNASNWLMGDFSYLLNKNSIGIAESKVSPKDLATMLSMIDKGTISKKIAKSLFEEMFDTGKDPKEIIEKRGLEQISDKDILEKIIQQVIDENPGPVSQYKDGKQKAIGFLIGKAMAKTKGKANPQLINELLRKRLGH